MYRHNDSLGGDILSGLVLGGLFYLFGKSVRENTLKEVEDACQNAEIEYLRKEIAELKKTRT